MSEREGLEATRTRAGSTASRIPPLPYAEWDTEALSVISGGRRLPPSNVLGLLAQHPELARAFLTFNRHLLATSTLPARTRELAILEVAWRRRCRYEWAQHVLIARKAGVTDEEIAGIRAGEATLMAVAVDELDESSCLSDQTYQALAAGLDDRQLMDLVFTIGTYGLLAMAFNTFGVELDPGLSDDSFGGASFDGASFDGASFGGDSLGGASLDGASFDNGDRKHSSRSEGV